MSDNKPQPNPKPGKHTVGLAVIADIVERMQTGKEKYGTYLETENGRDALVDAYQEHLDFCQYLKQAILEGKKRKAAVEACKNVYLSYPETKFHAGTHERIVWEIGRDLSE